MKRFAKLNPDANGYLLRSRIRFLLLRELFKCLATKGNMSGDAFQHVMVLNTITVSF